MPPPVGADVEVWLTPDQLGASGLVPEEVARAAGAGFAGDPQKRVARVLAVAMLAAIL